MSLSNRSSGRYISLDRCALSKDASTPISYFKSKETISVSHLGICHGEQKARARKGVVAVQSGFDHFVISCFVLDESVELLAPSRAVVLLGWTLRALSASFNLALLSGRGKSLAFSAR